MSMRWDRAKLEMRRQRGPTLIIAATMAATVFALIVLFSFIGVGIGGDQYEVKVRVETAKGVVPGRNEVRWAGVDVGLITAAEIEQGRPTLTLQIDRETGGTLYRDARLRLRPKTPLNDMYINVVNGGSPDAGRLEDAGVLVPARTETPVHVADVLNAFDADSREGLGTMITELGAALPDRGRALRSAFAEMAPWLVSVKRLTRELAMRPKIVSKLVHNTRLLMGELGDREQQLAQMMSAGASTFETLGENRDSLDSLVRELAPTLTRMESSMTELEGTVTELRPALRELRPPARALPAGLDAVREFSDRAEPALRTLRPAVSALAPFAAELAPATNTLDSAFSHLAPQLPTVDKALSWVENCERIVQKFFAYTLSTTKINQRISRLPAVRGYAVASLDAASGDVFKPPLIEPIESCADGSLPRFPVGK